VQPVSRTFRNGSDIEANSRNRPASGHTGAGPEFPGGANREVVPRLDDDRPCGVDVETVSRGLPGSGDVRSTLRALTGEASALVGGAS
jgi:histidine ammonia-lyase